MPPSQTRTDPPAGGAPTAGVTDRGRLTATPTGREDLTAPATGRGGARRLPGRVGRIPARLRERGPAVRFGVLVSLVAVAAGLAVFRGVDRQQLLAVVDRHGALAPLIAVGVSAVLVTVLAPRTALAFAGGAVFGPLLGTGYVVLGVTGGATAAYGIGRLLGRDFVAARLRGRLALVERAVAGGGLRAVAISRLIPLVPFGLANYAFGTSSVRLRSFVPGTALGVVPATIGYAALGSASMHGDAVEVSLAGGFVAALGIAGSVGTYLIWRRRSAVPDRPDRTGRWPLTRPRLTIPGRSGVRRRPGRTVG